MGMFDTINWADPLPYSAEMKELGLDKNVWSFQTKDLECALLTYVVQGKKISLIKYKNQRWLEGDPKAKSLTDRLGTYTHDGQYLEEIDLGTCTIIMYDHMSDVGPNQEWDIWVEFRVEVVRGKIKKVTLSEFSKTNNAERKDRDAAFWKQIETEKLLWYNRFIFHTRPWRKFAHRLSRGLNRAGNFLYTISYKIP